LIHLQDIDQGWVMTSEPVSTNLPTLSDSGARYPNIGSEIALLVLLSLIWGGSFTLIKVAIETVPAVTMVAARVTVAALLLLLLSRIRGFSLPRDRAAWAALFVQGLLQSVFPFTLISWGEAHIASGLAGVLNATPPMFVLFITLANHHQRQGVGIQKILGIGLGLAGVLVIMGAEAVRSVGAAAPLAQGAVLAASLCYALAPMWGRRFGQLPAIVTAAGSMSCAALLMLPAALVIDRPWTLTPAPEAIGAVAILAVVCTGVAMIVYFRLVRTLGALATTSGSYLRSGFSVALGILVLGERFTWSTLAGMMLIIAGVAAVTLQLRWPGLKQKGLEVERP
jgi:drug/metabolite transporter (DMT)-like permease